MISGSNSSLALIAAASIFLFSGCSSTPEPATKEQVNPTASASSPRLLLDYQTIWINPTDNTRGEERIGFVGTGPANDDLDSPSVNNVYDLNWRMIGFVLENGVTFRFDRDAQAERIGNFPIAKAILQLFQTSGTVRITPGI
ncbi:MAG TPA: hypothetical protein EYN00_02735 [Planctomycetes bacterium]|nr:hypothetical protein [Planctomycetota bacterium]